MGEARTGNALRRLEIDALFNIVGLRSAFSNNILLTIASERKSPV